MLTAFLAMTIHLLPLDIILLKSFLTVNEEKSLIICSNDEIAVFLRIILNIL